MGMAHCSRIGFGALLSDILTKRLSGSIGVEISKVNLADISDGQFEEIRQLTFDHAVTVIREQSLTPDRLEAFARRFGEPEQHVIKQFALPKNPNVFVVSNLKHKGRPIGAIRAGQYWHSDLSYMARPTMVSILHGLEVPSYGGDTMFTSMISAYSELSPVIKGLLENLTATHEYALAYEKYFNHYPERPPLTDKARAATPPVSHPVIRTHPDTKEKALYVNPGFTRHINELSPSESEAMLSFLFSHIQKPHFIYRHSWAVGDVVIWDNQSTCHLAIADYDMNEARHFIRVSVKGSYPN
ncbi:MAG: hypothetical protein CBB68_07800 [Rhodospirillaceae bacterium TMED8]|nr:taurine dioxygenase [Magnetovibrio sp.]OUT50882.1 MAG: hypothetical protein CBB68_07800 [Rhodospirillaceae bacterium TMED8]